jgi:glycosyltransferase involved in cell wall biosynthesis
LPAPPDSGAAPSVSICFPAYNEQESLRGVLEDAERVARELAVDYEILVCDDHSTDATAQIADGFAEAHPHVRVIHHAVNRGIRRTFEELYAESSKEFVFLNSTDGQWPTRVLLDLLPMAQSWDVIVASRRDKHYGPWRRLISGVFNLVPRILFGVRTHDAGAVKLVRREVILKTPVISLSPFSEAERLIRAARLGYRITEYPVETSARSGGKAAGARMGLLVAALTDVARVWWSLRSSQRGSDAETDTR